MIQAPPGPPGKTNVLAPSGGGGTASQCLLRPQEKLVSKVWWRFDINGSDLLKSQHQGTRESPNCPAGNSPFCPGLCLCWASRRAWARSGHGRHALSHAGGERPSASPEAGASTRTGPAFGSQPLTSCGLRESTLLSGSTDPMGHPEISSFWTHPPPHEESPRAPVLTSGRWSICCSPTRYFGPDKQLLCRAGVGSRPLRG